MLKDTQYFLVYMLIAIEIWDQIRILNYFWNMATLKVAVSKAFRQNFGDIHSFAIWMNYGQKLIQIRKK